MFPKAHLTFHSKMSGSRWVIIPSWLSGSLRPFFFFFLYSSSVYSCHLFLISSTSVRSIPFLSFIVPIFSWNFLVSLILLKKSCLSHYIPLFLCIVHLRRLSYLYLQFFELFIQRCIFFFSPLPFVSLLFSAICKASSDSILPFCISASWGWLWSLPPVQCYEPPSIVLQALCLSDLIPWICLSLPLYNRKGFYLGHTWAA